MTKSIYSQLRKSGAIPEPWFADLKGSEPGQATLRLKTSDTDPPALDVLTFLYAVLQSADERNETPVTIDVVAQSKGRDAITFAEYVSELASRGHDVAAINEAAAMLRGGFSTAQARRKLNAAAFFNLMKIQSYVTDDQVRDLIDAGSIYELIALVLEHAEATRARLNATKRHRENHAMKADAFVWLDANMADYKSMDKAAAAIVKLQPIAFRTARAWVGAWRKLRSAGKP